LLASLDVFGLLHFRVSSPFHALSGNFVLIVNYMKFDLASVWKAELSIKIWEFGIAGVVPIRDIRKV